jgi:two-component system, LytTR family, sensor kinase
MSDNMLATIICNNVFIVLFYYFNTYVLIPKLLINKKWGWYILSIAACLAAFLFLPKEIANFLVEPEFIRQNNEFVRNPDFKGVPKLTRAPRRARPIADPYNTVLFLLVFAFGTCISVTQRWLKTEQTRKETENEKLNTELSFLKSQVNPHFFFNTLNNIYSLAVVRSEKTAPAVMKLSSIMRYILTETERDLVPLRNEVDFIHNFIELQQVRLTDKVKLQFSATGDIETMLIAPLIFIPFVENAFKYGVSTKEHSSIEITIDTKDNQILFFASNNIVASENSLMENTGIGINNVKRRLELMYPERHKLTNTIENKTYIVKLEITT